jgi:hypothetical protein
MKRIGLHLAVWLAIGSSVSWQIQAQDATIRIHATQPGISGPVTVRAIIRKSDGGNVQGEWGESTWPRVAFTGKAMTPTTLVQVPPGTTQITIGKGPDYLPRTITTNLAPGGTYTIAAPLVPVLNLYGRGWRPGEIHAHFMHGERQINRTLEDIFAMSAAGGATFVSLCQEHYGAGTLTKQEMLSAVTAFDNSECKLWLGAEEPKNAWGHHASIVADPWKIRSPLPYWIGINDVQKQGGVVIPVHPQRGFPGRNDGGSSWYVFPYNNFYKAYPLHALLGNLDGWSGVSDEAYSPYLLPPYFKLLELGSKIPLLADSDVAFDRPSNGLKSPGFWTSYFFTGNQTVTRNSITHAIRSGRVMATTGPLVLFSIDGNMPGATLPADGATRRIRITANYSFNPWTLSSHSFLTGESCRISRIDLFRNGEVIKTWQPNAPFTTVEHLISENTSGSHYMVRVLGNEGAWMAGYASPIYFDNTTRPRHPRPFTGLVKGRLYDARGGAAVAGSVSCSRNGAKMWTLQTDSQGRFQAYVPLDAELTATDNSGRRLTRNLLNYEPAYKFCHNLRDNYSTNMEASVTAFTATVGVMEWEFPMGYQNPGSYLRMTLSGNAAMTNFAIVSAPSPTPGKQNTEITTIIVDKTQVQPGDMLNYAVIFRQTQGRVPAEEFSVDVKGWHPNYPRLYTKYGTSFHLNNIARAAIPIGGGFYVRQGSVFVPSWVANINASTPGIRLSAVVRGSNHEEASILISVGPSRRALAVSSTWDGLPANWGEDGVGPVRFHRQLTSQVRYSDYRRMAIRFTLNGQTVTVNPQLDTTHVADADNALFEDRFYYDGQCEPQFRNIPFRDRVRTQPTVSFAGVPVFNPQDHHSSQGNGSTNTNVVQLPIQSSWFGPKIGHERFVFWQHQAGYIAATVLSQTNFVSAQLLRGGQPTASGWQARGVDDFNRDGMADLAFQHTDRRTSFWYLRNAQYSNAVPVVGGKTASDGWSLRAVGDLSGDGRSDLLWHHSSGNVALWTMNVTNMVSSTWLAQTAWTAPAAIVDINRDSKKDILLQPINGTPVVWTMDGTNYLRTEYLRHVGTGWRLAGSADFNGDGRYDLLWQHTSGLLNIWFMDGTTFVRSVSLIGGRSVAPEWQAIGAK